MRRSAHFSSTLDFTPAQGRYERVTRGRYNLHMDTLVISGPLGSGKGYATREVARMATSRGLAVETIDLDEVNRELLIGPGPVADEIGEHCGPEYVVGGCVDRAALADLVFSDGGERAWLETLTHAAIAARLDELVQGARDRGVDVLVVEAPLPLAVSPAATSFARTLRGATVVSIAASREVRRALAGLRGDAAHDAARRIAAQPPQELYDSGASVTIENSGDADEFMAAVRRAVGPLMGGPERAGEHP